MPLSKKHWLLYGLAMGCIAVICVALWFFLNRGAPYRPSPLTFDGSSDKLQRTVVVPTLDTPLPEGKSAIWCVSFQLAWNHLKDDVAKEPLQITSAQPFTDRLNAATFKEEVIEAKDVYATAGLAKDNIVQRIRTEMASKFPHVSAPELDIPPGGAVAYAYLAAAAKFDLPFFENNEPFLFKDSEGKEMAVTSFGIRKKDDYAYHRLREQVQVLYCPSGSHDFIVDPCKTSQPYQIVLAWVNRQATLADTLAQVQERIAAPGATRKELGPNDTFLVPNMAWKITHRFKELEGKDKPFVNPALRGLYIDAAMQTIQFRLDRSGADLFSESKLPVKPTPTHFNFTRPFLIIMQKRGSTQPFFVMWVGNAELLEKR